MKRPSGNKPTLIHKSFSPLGLSFVFEVVGEVVSILFAWCLRVLKTDRHERHFKTPLSVWWGKKICFLIKSGSFFLYKVLYSSFYVYQKPTLGVFHCGVENSHQFNSIKTFGKRQMLSMHRMSLLPLSNKTVKTKESEFDDVMMHRGSCFLHC